MTAVATSETVALTGSAPSEPSIATTHPFTDIVHVHLTKSKDAPLLDYISKALEGCGLTSLVKVTASFTLTSGTNVQIGISEVGSVQPASVLSVCPGGINHTANAMNEGTKHQIDVIVPDILSTQLRPISSHLPSPRLVVSMSKEVVIVLSFFIKVHGMRTRYIGF